MLLGEYAVERQLGAGGFGRVVLARSRRSGQAYAVKRVLIADGAAQSRFLAEAQRWITLPDHPHITTCFFVRTVGDAVAVFSEYVSGGSLADWIADGRIYADGDGAPLERVLRIAIQSAWGLDAAHRFGLLHLDVKPHNVLLTANGVAKIADFGLADRPRPDPRRMLVRERMLDMFTDIGMDDLLDREALKSRLTQQMGTSGHDDPADVAGAEGLSPAYASPEQLGGARLTRATDVWSWALTVLEMFVGARTWPSGPDAGLALEELVQDPDARRALTPSPAVVTVLGSCFVPDPSARPASLGELADRLAAAYRDECARATKLERPPEPAERDPVMQLQTREAGGEMRWENPRGWLRLAYEAAGLDPEQAVAFWPGRTGTLKAQVLEELRALSEAHRVLAPVAGTEPDLLTALGHLRGDVARVRWFLGDRAEAIRSFESAIDALEAAGGETAVELAIVSTPLAGVLREAGRVEEARAAATRAVELCRGVDLDDRGRAALGAALLALALSTGDPARAAELRDEAGRVYELAGHEEGRLHALAEKAAGLQAAGREREAAEVWRPVEAALEGAGERLDTRLLALKARTLMNRAILADSQDETLRFGQAAVDAYLPLVRDRGLYRLEGELGEVLWMTGLALEHMGRRSEAAQAYRDAREVLEQALIRDGRHELADELARAYDHEATLVRDLGDPREAVALARRACQGWERLVEGEGLEAWGGALAVARVKLASCLGDADEPRAGLAEVDEALRLLEHEPNELSPPRRRQELAGAHLQHGVLLRQLGDPGAAIEAYRTGLKLVTDDPGDAEDRRQEAMLLTSLGNATADTGDLAAAIETYERAIERWEVVTVPTERRGAGGFDPKRYGARASLLKALTRSGDYERAVAVGEEAVELARSLVEAGGLNLEELVGVLVPHAIVLERVLDMDGAIEALLEAREHVERIERIDPDVRAAQLDAISLRLEWLERLTNGAPDDPRWVSRAQYDVQAAGDMLGSEDAADISMYLEDSMGRLLFLMQSKPSVGAIEACAETSAGVGLIASAAGRTEAARRGFSVAMDCCGLLTRKRGYLDRVEARDVTAALRALAESDDADLATLVAALDRRPLDVRRLKAEHWVVVAGESLGQLPR